MFVSLLGVRAMNLPIANRVPPRMVRVEPLRASIVSLPPPSDPSAPPDGGTERFKAGEGLRPTTPDEIRDQHTG